MCSPGWPRTQYINQADLKLAAPPVCLLGARITVSCHKMHLLPVAQKCTVEFGSEMTDTIKSTVTEKGDLAGFSSRSQLARGCLLSPTCLSAVDGRGGMGSA